MSAPRAQESSFQWEGDWAMWFIGRTGMEAKAKSQTEPASSHQVNLYKITIVMMEMTIMMMTRMIETVTGKIKA